MLSSILLVHALFLSGGPATAIPVKKGVASAPMARNGDGNGFVPYTEVTGDREFSGKLIVRPARGLDAKSRARALAAISKFPAQHNPKTDEYIVTVGVGPMVPGDAENAVAARLMATGLFQYACPDWIVYPVATPNDPRFPEQWHHTMMQSASAWDLHRADGPNGVIVAVTDTGIVDHPDLPNRVPGYNSVSGLSEADGADMADIHGHGTHVAGCAAARGDNGTGVSGMGWALRVMPIRVSTAANGGASFSSLLAGVQWAADNGAKVISASYSGIGYDPIETTGEYVQTRDASLLWAAGNSAANHSAWDFEHVVVVGASNQSDQRASFSSFGRGVDLFAPGTSILSSTRDGAYAAWNGTSMATPIANGALALMRSANPSLTPKFAEYLLFNSCDFWDGIANNETFGWGRINLRRAVEYALAAGNPQPPVARADRVRAVVGASVEIDVLANDFDPNMDWLEVQSASSVTSTGRAVSIVHGSAGERDRLMIAETGDSAGTQTLSYTLVEPVTGATSSATVTVETTAPRPADNPVGAQQALQAKYYELTSPSVLPDFSQLTNYASNLVGNLNYPSTSGDFGDSGRADNVGAVYTGWIEIPTAGFWTLGLTSDDGSKLWIGSDLVVNNDGLHGMQTVSGTRALAAGKHALRVEFFEAGGGAGLVMSWSGPGTSTTAVPASRLFNGGAVEPADLNRDGFVNSQDLAVLLGAWGNSGGAADLDSNGTVGSADLAILLSRWAG